MYRRYHGKCLKIARGKVKEDDKYTCPICDYRVKIPRDAARPKLEDLTEWQQEIQGLPFVPDEMDCLDRIIDAAQKFRNFVGSYTNSPLGLTSAEVPTMRFYLRKIEGAEILLAHETNFFRSELHKWMPIAPEPPPSVEISMSTRKPRPTKQQKLMAQMGIKNPDDLPMQFRTKTSAYKKKPEGSSNGNGPAHLQPAPSSQSLSSPGLSATPTQMRHDGQRSSQPPSASQSHFEYGQRFGSAGGASSGSPTFSHGPTFSNSPNRMGSPVLMNNPGRGQTLDPALFNPGFHGHAPPTTTSPSASPHYSAANSREVNNIFEQLTNHDSDDLYAKNGPVSNGFEQAIDQSTDSLDSSLASQFLHEHPL